jgi:hypothetical protein
MHRLTARFLFLFVLVGNFVPLALAVAAGQAHACCVRKAAHHCYGWATASSSRILHGTRFTMPAAVTTIVAVR